MRRGNNRRARRAHSGMVNVNFGSGPHRLDGWINVDLDPEGRPDVIADLGEALPFATGAVDFIFSEDTIAYLGLDAVRVFLAECRRVLKPDGAMRVLTPDLAKLARMYLDEPAALVALWDRTVGVPATTGTACEVFNHAMELAGNFHLDGPTLRQLAHAAGFTAVPVRYRESRYPALSGLDLRRPDDSVSMYHEFYPGG
jgi:SAM-dependent methyltransferase